MEDRECSQEKSRLAIAVVGGEIKSRARAPPGTSVHERQRRGKSAGKKDRRGARYFTRACTAPINFRVKPINLLRALPENEAFDS